MQWLHAFVVIVTLRSFEFFDVICISGLLFLDCSLSGLAFQGGYYDMVVSTKLAGLGHSMFLWLSTVRNKVSYTFPDVNAAGATRFLDIAIPAPQLELAESGFNM